MDYTYQEYFNYYLKECLNELINTFPETQQPLLANYRPLLEGRDDKNDLYAKCFYTKINNFLAPIAKRDITLFETPGKIFIEGVDLHFIWNNSNANDTNRTAIWKYLQILMILGRKIIPNHKEIVELLQKVSNGDIMIPAKVEKTLTTEEKDESESAPGVFGLGDIASSLGSLGSLAGGLGLDKLASGLTGGSGEGGDAGAGIGGLLSGITQMFSNPEFTNAMSQLSQSMAANLPTQPEGTGASANESHEHACEAGTQGASGHAGASGYASASGTKCNHMNETGVSGEAGAAAAAEPNTTAPPLFNNPLFGDLAKELTETFNFEDMEKDGKPANIGDAIGKFMKGNNPAKLMNLVGKFGSKLQQEVQSGSINPADLLQQTMGAMGPGMANMMQNMAGNPKMRQAAQAQSTRDRLRAKLEKRNATDKQ
jgi:hypothetical protein